MVCKRETDFDWFHRQFAQNSSLTIVHINVRSLRKHWDTFRAQIHTVSSGIDVFVLTEINIFSWETSFFTLPGFTSFWRTREGQRGGGIVIFVQQALVAEKFTVVLDSAESLGVKISNQSTHITLIAIYRPPSGDLPLFIHDLNSLLDKVRLDFNLCVTGDFNIDILNHSRSSTLDYLDILTSYGLDSVIDAPTREEFLRGRLVKSCLDHFNIRSGNLLPHAAVISQKVADHYYTLCQFNAAQCSPKLVGPSQTQSYTVVDISKFDKLVALFDWSSLLKNTDKLNLYQAFSQAMQEIYRNSQKTVYVRKRQKKSTLAE